MDWRKFCRLSNGDRGDGSSHRALLDDRSLVDGKSSHQLGAEKNIHDSGSVPLPNRRELRFPVLVSDRIFDRYLTLNFSE